MRPLAGFHRVLTDSEVEELHDAALGLLADPGLRIENPGLCDSLRRRGAQVEDEIVRFPRELIEHTLALAAGEEQVRVRAGVPGTELAYPDQLTFSWHTPFRDRAPARVQASIGGGAPLYYDHAAKTNRYASGEDFLRLVRLAEGIPEIVTVGNGVHYLKEADGRDVAPKMVAIKGAALAAKHSSKPGCTAIIDRRQLPYLMEMGEIVKGSAEAYLRNPILVNIHDTEPPLRLTRPEAALIEAMAGRRLPIFILPMPLAGISSPVYPIAAAALAAAEILGVWAAAKALREDCPVQARCCSGVLNPATGAASFATPETMLIDLAVAQLFRERYGLPCGTGVGLIDAPIPGALSVFERTCKVFASALAGEPSFPVGIIGGAVVFSPEQVLLDLDIAATAVQYLRGIGGEHFAESLGLIRARGIGGLHLDTDHTAAHFRECLQLPAVFSRLKSTDVRNALAHDPVELAHNRVQDLLARTPLYSIGQDQARAIDRVVREAEKVLASITGAME
jgi:trimethylamine--corrinoid protein Co-methyltransferase